MQASAAGCDDLRVARSEIGLRRLERRLGLGELRRGDREAAAPRLGRSGLAVDRRRDLGDVRGHQAPNQVRYRKRNPCRDRWERSRTKPPTKPFTGSGTSSGTLSWRGRDETPLTQPSALARPHGVRMESTTSEWMTWVRVDYLGERLQASPCSLHTPHTCHWYISKAHHPSPSRSGDIAP